LRLIILKKEADSGGRYETPVGIEIAEVALLMPRRKVGSWS